MPTVLRHASDLSPARLICFPFEQFYQFIRNRITMIFRGEVRTLFDKVTQVLKSVMMWA